MTGSTEQTRQIDRIALLGNFLPRHCGLATFTTDTYTALTDRYPGLAVDVYAMDDHPGRYAYPDAVTWAIPEQDRDAYLEAARRITASGAKALWVQHEYGIYGGPAGSHLLTLLSRLTIPVIVTLHTVLEYPNEDQRRVMTALLSRAAKVIVMAERGREILIETYAAHPATIAVIPHGVPDRNLIDTAAMKPRFGFEGREVLLTFGLLAPNKGIETMIAAMPAIVAAHPQALYVVLGATHPNLIAHEGEAYRDRLIAQAGELGVADNVCFVDGFVDYDLLLDYLQAADIYVTPYLNREQITSGTLSYAVGLGKAVVSTPYVHAAEILADDHGVLVPFRDSAALSAEILRLLDDRVAHAALIERAYARGRTMTWPRLAEKAMALLDDIVARKPARIAKPALDFTPLAPDLRAVERMSDATGMLQHSIYSVPDRRHGYCIDDNARALMLVNRMEDLSADRRHHWATVYAAFIQFAWNEDARRFRNFMRFDRTWCEEVGSEDSNGRAIWALGTTARDGHDRGLRDWATVWFDRTAALSFELKSPRTMAFAMLGAAALLERHPGHALSKRILADFGDALMTLADRTRRPEWRWFEIVLAYDNCRLPEALIRGGMALGRQDMIDCGLDTLDWIVAQQTSPEGRFRAVGTESFGRELEPPLPFDQQPLEAQATIDACVAAYDATGAARWADEAMRAYRWYLGANDLDMPLATAADGGCFDGLHPNGLNRNQGAESILALQLASVAISDLSKRVQFGKDAREPAVA